jgi:hypothetical protein
MAIGTADIFDGFGQRFRTARTDGYARPSRGKKDGEKTSEAARAAGNQHMRALDCKWIIHRKSLAD